MDGGNPGRRRGSPSRIPSACLNLMYLAIGVPLCLLALLVVRFVPHGVPHLAYGLFMSTSVLSLTGAVGVLTGFSRNDTQAAWFGISFLTLFVAHQLATQPSALNRHACRFVLTALNPMYLFTGPFPSGLLPARWTGRRFFRRLRVVQRDLIVGVFFAAVVGRALSKLLVLKSSTEVVDVLLFGVVFEFFVYFNFCGFSMIAWSVMRLAGIQVERNFRQPFAARSVIDYWKRWHVTLSQILKTLFFGPLRARVGLYAATTATFLASALWHGVSVNFMLWGLFHAAAWCLAHGLFGLGRLRLLNGAVLIVAVVFGRILFSEIDTTILLHKIQVVLSPSLWSLQTQVGRIELFGREIFELAMAGVLVGLEVILPRVGYAHRDYQHLKLPLVSTTLLAYLVVFFNGFGNAPIYGNR